MIVVGVLSGTSADGVDAVVTRILGTPPALTWEILAHTHQPFDPALRAEIFAGFQPATGTVDRLCQLNFALGRAFAQAALAAIAAAGLKPENVDLIGSHGQTMWHEPDGPNASTLQLGEPSVIAEQTGIPVIANFRTADMAAGGQGAPLVAYVDRLLLSDRNLSRAVQNIGGIANVTFLPAISQPDLPLLAFDTGPGNVLIDELARLASAGAQQYDINGQMAAAGQVSAQLLNELLAHPYLGQQPPKTTGRTMFGQHFAAIAWERGQALDLSAQDCLATLTAFTAESIAHAYRQFLPVFPDEVIVCGGGARNPTLLKMLRERLAPARVLTSDEIGLPAQQKEALAFAILAYETWHQRPANLPQATGARHPVVLGLLAYTKASIATGSATESRNPATMNIDQLSTLEMVERINIEDHKVAEAVASQLPAIARAVDGIAERLSSGGRLIYVGAGTSGRLGVLDASECPPTFNTPPGQVMALTAGGDRAVGSAVEGAEDDEPGGAQAVASIQVDAKDAVVGIAASGGTPYVLGALREARQRGALTISVACNHPAPIENLADIAIAPVVGPEVITGSTRLKAGTAQKMVLNMLTTGAMVRLGKTYGNLMVDVQKSNRKLEARARRIVAQACQIDEESAGALLERCDGEVKTAIVMSLLDLNPTEARQRLVESGGRVRQAVSQS